MTATPIFNPAHWEPVAGFSFTDITYHRARAHGTVRVAFNRPEVRNAFRPQTVDELYTALPHGRGLARVADGAAVEPGKRSLTASRSYRGSAR